MLCDKHVLKQLQLWLLPLNVGFVVSFLVLNQIKEYSTFEKSCESGEKHKRGRLKR